MSCSQCFFRILCTLIKKKFSKVLMTALDSSAAAFWGGLSFISFRHIPQNQQLSGVVLVLVEKDIASWCCFWLNHKTDLLLNTGSLVCEWWGGELETFPCWQQLRWHFRSGFLTRWFLTTRGLVIIRENGDQCTVRKIHSVVMPVTQNRKLVMNRGEGTAGV